MASITGQAVGYIATLYQAPSLDSVKDEASLSALAVSGNQIIDVKDMSTGLSKERSIVDVPVFGSDTAGKIPGQVDPGTFDFSVAYNGDDTVHNGMRDNDGKTPTTYILVFNQAAGNVTYAAFDGYVANATVNFSIDDVITMDCSIARSGAVTWVDAA